MNTDIYLVLYTILFMYVCVNTDMYIHININVNIYILFIILYTFRDALRHTAFNSKRQLAATEHCFKLYSQDILTWQVFN